MEEIIGIPPSNYEYEFMLVKPVGKKYKWMGNYEYYTAELEQRAKKEELLICHNLRVSHKKEKN